MNAFKQHNPHNQLAHSCFLSTCIPYSMQGDQHYESIKDALSTKPVPSQPSRQHEVYSEVFDALPKGEAVRIVRQSTIKQS